MTFCSTKNIEFSRIKKRKIQQISNYVGISIKPLLKFLLNPLKRHLKKSFWILMQQMTLYTVSKLVNFSMDIIIHIVFFRYMYLAVNIC